MMLQDNVNILLKYSKDLLDQIVKNEEQLKNSTLVTVHKSKMGLPTMQIQKNNTSGFIHSKYDPHKEARAFISQYEDEIDNYNHIFFYGIGMGYHVEELMKRCPNKNFSIYEPMPEIFYQFISNRKLSELPIEQLKYIYVEWSQKEAEQFIENFTNETEQNVLFVVIPSYERIFSAEYNFFITSIKNKFQQKKMNLGTNFVFSKRWTLNALMNLPITLNSPDFLTEKKTFFKGKPVLLVAAGPSLEDEIENLRFIKKNKLAYIFAVGSANKALVANNILPDAVCTYDPSVANSRVFKEMIENGYDKEVPMIYGTTVGFETLEHYKGPKFFVLTAQDTISPYFLKCENGELPIVNDAYSIAIITLQILSLLEVDEVILVGQNFAFRNNQIYSKGISHGERRPTELKEQDLRNKLFVPDVNGNQVMTNPSLNQMRLLMEDYIDKYKNLKVINATNEGAAIKGAPYIPLKEVITKDLLVPVVEEHWYEQQENNKQDVKEQIQLFKKDINRFKKNLLALEKSIEALEKGINKGRFQNALKRNKEFENNIAELFNNKIFNILIKPVLRLETSRLDEKIKKVVQEISNPKIRMEEIVKLSSQFVKVCKLYFEDYNNIIQTKIFPKLLTKNLTFYSSIQNRDVFKTTGHWVSINEVLMAHSKEAPYLRLELLRSNVKGSSLQFKFTGNIIRIIASMRKDFATKIAITIDGKKEYFSTKDIQQSAFENPNRHQTVFEKAGLKNGIHQVEIELLENKEFIFEGIEINSDGKLFHIDEKELDENLAF